MNNYINTIENNEQFTTNCLALTIRKDYKLTIASHIASTFKRVSLKLMFNVGLLNILSMIL